MPSKPPKKKLHSTRGTSKKLCSLHHPPLMPSAKFNHFHMLGTAHAPIIVFPYTQATCALAMSYDALEDNNSTPQYHLMPHRMLFVCHRVNFSLKFAACDGLKSLT